MTIAPAPRHTTSEPASSAWRARLPGTVGIAYVVTWVVGLAVWPVNLALNATAAQVAASPARTVASKEARLRELKHFYDEGLITDDVYRDRQKAILAEP